MPKDKLVTVIDVGSCKVATIIASITEERVSVIGVSTVLSKGIRKGVVVDIDSAVEAIAESLEKSQRMSGFPVSSAFVTVNGSHIESINSHGVVAVSHQDSEITEDDIKRVTDAAQAVSLPSSREMIHVIPRDFIVDGQEGVHDPLGMSGVRLEVETNLIHGSSPAIKNLAKCVIQVGVSVEDFVFSSYASSYSVLTDTEKELGTILLDIGGGTASLIIFCGGSPCYSSVLPVGGQNITNDLAIGLRASLDVAEKIKLKLGKEDEIIKRTAFPTNEEESVQISRNELDVSEFNLDASTISRKLLYDIMKERMRELFTLVALEVKKANYTGKLPAGIVLTGGGSLTYNIIPIAKEVLKMPARIAKPRGVTGLIDEIEGPAYSAAIGTLIFGAKQIKTQGRQLSPRGNLVPGFIKGAFGWVKSFLP
ncbi:cell division protein FtsA [candidate division WWE3 bacterium CG08_land_8_20_14_0_20_40_13]|uniref:Cell division protein FtsA n=1 Tax=candidate division WWE3 bacterium CG08_land_8_20_14_0_20_40_13 TaxID=1975084 RepID=A0A2H0XDG2_UNCKA|nr:MAG: cell division protein FtsA [candidate division WWE3 bacterium CG08_land_8_20_14_0_20_40_13]